MKKTAAALTALTLSLAQPALAEGPAMVMDEELVTKEMAHGAGTINPMIPLIAFAVLVAVASQAGDGGSTTTCLVSCS